MKLTAVSLYYNGRRVQAFLHFPLNEKRQPVLPTPILNQMLNALGCTERGMTYSVG